MAVFVCAADETTDGQNFLYGGFAAPVTDWDTFFTDAWSERVLVGPPAIPYLHMTEMRDWGWQHGHGLSPLQANQRIDEATRVIRSSGSLIPIVWSVSEEKFRRLVRPFAPRGKTKVGLEQPDYLAFLSFAYTTLYYLRTYCPEVERVDFWLERNDRITKRLEYFHSRLIPNLKELSRPELAELVGELHVVGKDHIPAQAADLICWHERNAARGRLDRDGQRRLWRMTETRRGHRGDFGDLILDELHEALKSKFPVLRAV